MRKIGVLVVLMFLLVLPFVVAEIDYNESGNFNNFYQLGLGVFNENLDPVDVNAQTTTVIVSNGRKIPLISDLDGDGVAEIIILDGRNIEIYQNKTLSIVASFTLDTAANERFSNMITFDIDGDGLREIIIVAEKERELYILEYNRSSLVNQTRFQGTNLSDLNLGGGTFGGEVVIKCSSTERCLMLYSNFLDTGFSGFPQTNTFFGSFFNSSENSVVDNTFTTALDTSSSFSVFCQPNIRHIVAIDYDGDDGGSAADPSEFEFIASNFEVEQSVASDESVNIYWVDILPNHSVVLDQPVVTSTRPSNILSASITGEEFTCDNSNNFNVNADGAGHPLFAGFYVTSPLVFDADPTAGLETIVGMGIDPDEFKIIMFEKDGSFLDDFPEVADSEGIMISNLFKADIFDDSTQDFCVMGFNGDPIGSVEDSLSVTCGSKNDPNGFGAFNIQTLQFRFDKQGLFNISQTYDNHGVLAHASEQDQSNDLDEVVSAYGVLKLDRDDSIFSACAGILGSCDMDLIFQQPKSSNNPRVISTDAYDNVGLDDMVILTDNNLFYLDDGFTNQPATIINLFTNPCLDSVWKINTSVEIKIIATDPEDDTVSVKVTLYESDTNEQTIGFVNTSSGTEIPFSFIANKSIGGGNLLIEALDPVNNPDDVDTIEKVFSVAQNGVEFNDCTTTQTFLVDDEIPIDELLNVSVAATANQGLTDFVEGASNTFRVSPLIVVLLLMLGWSIAVMTTMDRANDSMITMNKVMFLLIGNGLIFIVGSIIGAIPFGVLLVVIILGIFSIVLWARRAFTSNAQM